MIPTFPLLHQGNKAQQSIFIFLLCSAEESEHPDVVIHREKDTPFKAASKVLLKLKKLGFLEEADHSVFLKQEEKDIRRILRETWFK